MKRVRYITIALAALGVACSDLEQAGPADGQRETIAFRVDMPVITVSERAVGRASNPFNYSFDLLLTQTDPSGFAESANTNKYKTVHQSGEFGIFVESTNAPVYWDDRGGRDALIDLQGVYPKGYATTYDTPFDFTIASDQNPDPDENDDSAYEASDLVISDKITGYSVGKQKAPAGTKPVMQFRHVLSKLTFELSMGTGFTIADFEPTIETVKMPLECDVTIEADGSVTRTTDSGGSESEIKPFLKTKGSGKYTFEAVVMPGQVLDDDDRIAQITINIGGHDNVYDVRIPATAGMTLAAGYNYTFKVKVNKVDTQVAVTIEDWENVDVPGQTVQIAVEGGTLLDNDGVDDGASFYLDIDNKHKRKFTYDQSGNEWNTDTPLHWDDVNWRADLYGDGLLYDNAGDVLSSPTPEYIYTSGSRRNLKRTMTTRWPDM